MEPNSRRIAKLVVLLCLYLTAVLGQVLNAPTVSPPFTPRPAFCSARTCVDPSFCPNPAPGVATCDASTGAWTVSGQLLGSQITAQIQCQLSVSGDLKMTTAGQTVSFGPCGQIVVGGVAEFSQTAVAVDFTGWDLSNLPVSVPLFSYKCVTGLVSGSRVSGLPMSASGSCNEVPGSPTDYFITLRQSGCATYRPPPACAVPCSDVTCNNNVLCPQPFTNAQCNSATGEWQVTGNLDTGSTVANQRVACIVRVSGSVTVSGTHTFGRCGNIITTGQTTINQGLTFIYDFGNYGLVGPNAKLPFLTYGSVTGIFSGASFVNIEGTVNNQSLQYAPQKADTTYSVVTALRSDPPIPQDVSLSSGTGSQNCALINCTTSSACPSPAAGATCDLMTGAWVVPAPFDTSSVTGEIGCSLSTQGNMAVGNSLTFGPCGKLVASGVLNIADSARLTFNLKGMALSSSTSIEFARYSSASGLFSFVGVQNIAISNTTYAPQTQKDNMVYRLLFYVQGTPAPPADISTNSPPPAGADCSTITCANVQGCPSPFQGATCQGGAWTLSSALTTGTAATGQPINCAVNVNGRITVNSNLAFGVCGSLNTPNQMVIDSTSSIRVNMSGKAVQAGTQQVFASFSSASGQFGPVSSSNFVPQPAGAALDAVAQKQNSNYALVFYTRGTPAPPTDVSNNAVSGTCAARSCADSSCPSPFPGAQCQASGWTIASLTLTSPSNTIMCPVTVTGNAQISSQLNFDGCGLLNVVGTVDIQPGASVSASLGGDTFPVVQLNTKFTFMTFSSSSGTFGSVNIPSLPSGSASGLKPGLQKDSYNYYLLFIDQNSPNPPEMVSTGNPPTTGGTPNPTTGTNPPPGSTTGGSTPTSGGQPPGNNPNPATSGSSGGTTPGSTTSQSSGGTPPGGTPGGTPPGGTPGGTPPGGTPGGTPPGGTPGGTPPGGTPGPNGQASGNSTATAVTSPPEAAGGLPWWAWLLIAIAILFVCICVVLCLVCLCKKAASEKV